MKTVALLLLLVAVAKSFSPSAFIRTIRQPTCLFGAVESVTGEELELLMDNWDTPLVVDAYATWCGPCQLMAPEFEAAAEELKGKVRFVKMDTDREELMASRLNIQGLPTILFLAENKEEGESVPKAILKGRIEGAMRKDAIQALCEHFFFDGPVPEMLQ